MRGCSRLGGEEANERLPQATQPQSLGGSHGSRQAQALSPGAVSEIPARHYFLGGRLHLKHLQQGEAAVQPEMADLP